MLKNKKYFLFLIYLFIFVSGIALYQNNETVNSGVNVFIHETQIQTQNIINQVTGKRKLNQN